MKKFSDEAIGKIEAAIPIVGDATALDIWRGSGGVSYQAVKIGLKGLVEHGRAIRFHERYRDASMPNAVNRYRYRRVAR